jgi:hypothetical protein
VPVTRSAHSSDRARRRAGNRLGPLLSAVMIRAAREADLPALEAVPPNAGTRFREAGMAAVADLEPERRPVREPVR